MLLLPLRSQRALCLPRGETVFTVLSVGDFSIFPLFCAFVIFFFWLLVSRLLFVSVMFLFILCSYFSFISQRRGGTARIYRKERKTAKTEINEASLAVEPEKKKDTKTCVQESESFKFNFFLVPFYSQQSSRS